MGFLAGGHGIADGAGLPRFRGVNEGGEERAGQGADNIGALGMPLNAEDEMIGRIELDCFDDAIGGRDGCDAKVVADLMDGLVVAGVDGGLDPLGIVLSQVSWETWGTHCRAL